MKKLYIIALAPLVFSATANAQDKMPMQGMEMKGTDMSMMMPMPGDSEATKGYKTAMMKMMQSMPKPTGDADKDFMMMMRGHHQAAIDMAKVELSFGKDVQAKKLAQEIVTAQEKEIATIDAWMKKGS